MIINKYTYKLPDNNFIRKETTKKYIIIGNTFNDNMRHINGWLNRYNGRYKKTSAYTINREGFIYEHFNPKFYSEFFKNNDLNCNSIIILIENYGWITEIETKNKFITWFGDIYKYPDKIYKKRWRNHTIWESYNAKQIESVAYLVNKLCLEFDIPLSVESHNTKINLTLDYKGILYKSNIDKNSTDINPSWDFELFKRKIEKNEEY